MIRNFPRGYPINDTILLIRLPVRGTNIIKDKNPVFEAGDVLIIIQETP